MAACSVAVHPSVRQTPSISTKHLTKALKRFRLHLLADVGLKPSTTDNYRRMLSKLLRDLGSAAPGHDALREYVAAMREAGYSHSYVSNVCLVIEAYTAHQGRCLCLGRGKKPLPAPKEPLSEGEVAVIMAACRDPRERAVISLLAYSGMRNEELCRLRPADILMDTRQVRIRQGKGGSGRLARISGKCCTDAAVYLSEHPRGAQDWLFTSLRRGRQFEGATVRRLVRRVVARTMIQKPVHPHLFRHSLACNMLSRGANLFAIRDQLGHADIQTTMIYLRSANSRAAAQYEMYCPSYS
ncbi:MAG: tyrosine-type recombinase/integrase [Desulfobacterales bacterium]|nr:tyrosine-type recombinase/integrase [Desulfobacterales bacterium]